MIPHATVNLRSEDDCVSSHVNVSTIRERFDSNQRLNPTVVFLARRHIRSASRGKSIGKRTSHGYKNWVDSVVAAELLGGLCCASTQYPGVNRRPCQECVLRPSHSHVQPCYVIAAAAPTTSCTLSTVVSHSYLIAYRSLALPRALITDSNTGIAWELGGVSVISPATIAAVDLARSFFDTLIDVCQT
ncbi:hypothetical protein J6590_001838 [Homalodisca vitripennis]|nr:hypothetical protein J6590_001838 [Homalodisca vitripennis]